MISNNNSDLFLENEILKNKKLTPIFIIGLPRSGSKLIRDLLNNNKEIFFPKAECVFIPYFVRKYGFTPKFHIEKNRKKVINDLSNSTYLYNLEIKRNELDNETFSQILKTNLWSVIFRYLLNDLPNNKKKNLFFGDKTPESINYVKLLKTIFPKAKFIHMIRDSRDQALSSRTLWGKNLYRNAQSWRDSIINVRRIVSKDDIQYLEVKYEDLTRYTDLTLNKVCDFIGCSYHQTMLDLKDPVEGTGIHSKELIITKNNSNKFYELLTTAEIKKIEELTLDVLCNLDYHLTNKRISIKRLNIIESLIYKLIDSSKVISFHILAKGLINGLRYVYYFNKYKK